MKTKLNPTLELIKNRYSVRVFKDQEPNWSEVQQVVESAAYAASSKNTQPWTLNLVKGETLQALRAAYLNAFDGGRKPESPYEYAPQPMPGEWMALARECGFSLFKHKGIARDDRQARQAHGRENFAFFNAPGVFFLSTLIDAGLGNFLDCGLFLQNLVTGLSSIGLGSVPMFSAVAYPDLVKKFCPESQDLLICGLTFGVPDEDAHVNQFRTTRRELNKWFHINGDNHE